MKKNTILLVDDEEGIRKVLGIYLADMDYKVLTAKSGEEALDIFRKDKPSIVIADIRMPGMNGIELLHRLKKEEPETEVIMMTGHGEMDLAIESVQLDATDFITKPIKEDVLGIALNRAEERISMRQKLKEYTQNLEQMVQEKTNKLIEAERLAAVGQTVAGLSHAIKNIASGLKGGAFVLEEGIQQDNRKYLLQGWEMVKGNVDKIINLSLDLLDYAKTAEVSYQLCEPNEPAHEVIELMKPKAEELGITLESDFAQDLEAFHFDPELIHRCLLNLVTNAIDACSEEKASNKEKEVIVRTSAVEGWGVEYQVMDNGCGMEEDTKENLFKSFFTTKGSRGTGIGLMITKKIIDGHKGLIEVEFEKGGGSKFTIRLPKGPTKSDE
jgi:signal transduction histidine kinase